MSEPLFLKRYASPVRLRRAVRNHRWLAASGLPVPRLVEVRAATGELGFERVEGRHAVEISDLARVSAQLGHLDRRLGGGGPDDDDGGGGTPSLQEIEPFLPPREQLLQTLRPPGRLIDPSQIEAVRELVECCPPSVYKDVNVRNVLVSEAQIHHVDFDDLSQAPAGYDLAKLLVSWAMTHGRRPPVDSLLAAYNQAAGKELCAPGAFAVWIELHHVLTHRYLERGSYRHQWPAVRTPEDERRIRAALAP